jgi:hypothetical protein
VESSTIYLAATLTGAAFLGARSARMCLSGAGTNHVRPQNPELAAWTNAHATALPPVLATPTQLVPAPVAGNPVHVHKTQIGAGGSGALGSHPEREPAY